MTHFPQALKRWRKARRLSQLQLAGEAEVSLRHLSFLETGRARPSAEMVGRLGEALRLPLSARNQMLALAGFAARYPGRDWDEAEMAPIRAALDHMLAGHEPFPAIAFDRMWRVVRLNRAARRLFAPLDIDEGGYLLELFLSDRLPELIENWPAVAHHTARRLQTESAAQGGIEELDRVAEVLAKAGTEEATTSGPVVPTIYRFGPLRLSLFGTIAQFGTPEDITLDDLKIELFFPADAESEKTLRAMASAEPG